LARFLARRVTVWWDAGEEVRSNYLNFLGLNDSGAVEWPGD
jgi:hypothetical protein